MKGLGKEQDVRLRERISRLVGMVGIEAYPGKERSQNWREN